MFFLFICLACLAVGLVLLWRARQLRAQTGLPPGTVSYVDTTQWKVCQRPFFSEHYRLVGKPDYVVRHQDLVIPVEVKSSTGPGRPYDSHKLQLLAYCLLVEEAERRAPPFGLLHYPDADFRIEYTAQARKELITTLAQLRSDLTAPDVSRGHSNPSKCRSCGYRHACTQRL